MESSHIDSSETPQGVDLRDKIPTNASTGENPPSPSTSQAHDQSDAIETTSNACPETLEEGDLSSEITASTDSTEQSPSPSTATRESDTPDPTGSASDNNPDLTNSLETQCPPKQVMERPAGEGGDSNYKIPSHVFARNTTSSQMEWSTASNESLFSIQMGNMSFTKEQFLWMSKSEDLFDLDPNIRPSMELPSNQQSTARQSADVGKKGGNFGDRIGDTEAAAAEMMRQVIMENEADKKQHQKLPETNTKPANLAESNSNPRNSDGNTTSFAFPILPGQVDKNASVSAWPKHNKQQVHASQPSKEPPTQPNANLGSDHQKKRTSAELPNQKAAATQVDKGRWSCLSGWPFR